MNLYITNISVPKCAVLIAEINLKPIYLSNLNKYVHVYFIYIIYICIWNGLSLTYLLVPI